MTSQDGRFELDPTDVGRWFLRRDGQTTQVAALVNAGRWQTEDGKQRAADGIALACEDRGFDLVERLPEGWPEQTP